jgi:hypothetical protein
MKIAVVGAGFFGVTIALKLAEKNYRVTLFDFKDDILTSASRTNQLRLHRGYHYPRSKDTVRSLLDSLPKFLEYYGNAAIKDYDHYYSIAKEGSKVDKDYYLDFLDYFGLEYSIVNKNNFAIDSSMEVVIKAKESLLDYHAIYEICKERLLASGVTLQLKTNFSEDMIASYDKVVNCTYSEINALTPWEKRREYQFEVCEKICVQAPKNLQDVSLVVMDGPFMCIDPYGRTGKSLLGNVVHAIHTSNIGHSPIIPDYIKPYLNKGIVSVKEISNFNKFIEAGKDYIANFNRCEYFGSMFTVRAVLPYKDDSDERPTIVTKMDGNVINIFSGKIDTCVQAADEVLETIK